MQPKHLFLLILLISTGCKITSVAQSNKISGNKSLVLKTIDSQQNALIKLSDDIWGYAEPSMLEYKSSKALADYAEAQGFKVERGVAELPTGFIASYGSGRPIIGILGEYDALPGVSQKASSVKEPLEIGAAGHGCGHNMFGPASLGAAIAIKELMEAGKLKGTIRFYGTPAEEAVGGKIYMARAGLFNDLDACLDWHPDEKIVASTQSSQAVIDYLVTFKGKAAHAAYDPWNGRSALDGVESFLDGINLLREHVKPSVRMHYVIQKGGDIPNVIPEFASVWLWIRDSKMEGVLDVEKRMKDIAKGAGLIAGVESEVILQNGIYEILVNRTGAAVLQKNIELLGPIIYTPEEIAFANAIQKTTEKPLKGIDGSINPLEPTNDDPVGGSTDVGDVSWLTPEITLLTTTAPVATPWHSWAVVACGGMSIGHKGMLFSAKALALTMVDLYENPTLLTKMKEEFTERKGDFKYEAMLPFGPPPVPKQD